VYPFAVARAVALGAAVVGRMMEVPWAETEVRRRERKRRRAEKKDMNDQGGGVEERRDSMMLLKQ